MDESQVVLQILEELKKINENLQKINEKLNHGITTFNV